MKRGTKKGVIFTEEHKRNISKSMMGKRNSYRNARYVNKKGYVTISVNGRQKLEHRHVVENHIGRKLVSNEIVHHINGIKNDNRIENLEIVTHKENIRLHHELVRNLLKQYRENKFLCTSCGGVVRHLVIDCFICKNKDCKELKFSS